MVKFKRELDRKIVRAIFSRSLFVKQSKHENNNLNIEPYQF